MGSGFSRKMCPSAKIEGNVFRLRTRSVPFVGHLPGVTAAFSLEGLWKLNSLYTLSGTVSKYVCTSSEKYFFSDQ